MKHLFAPLAAALVLAACASSASGPRAVAQLQSTTGNTTSGTVSFVQSGDKVLVSGEIRGLKPGAEHGFHVHEKGDCSSGDGMSTGGHFNPDAKPHGPPNAPHHAGDLPAVVADAYGNATAAFTLNGVSIGTGAADLVGR